MIGGSTCCFARGLFILRPLGPVCLTRFKMAAARSGRNPGVEGSPVRMHPEGDQQVGPSEARPSKGEAHLYSKPRKKPSKAEERRHRAIERAIKKAQRDAEKKARSL